MKNVNNSKLRIIPLGGLEQIGMNITAFEFEDSIVVVDCFSKEEEQGNDSFSFRVMLPLAIATSIDALATGVTFAMMGVNIWIAIAITGLTTFVFSVAGVKIGNLFGSRYQSKAELVGGLILIAMGFKILVEHLLGKA